MDREYVNMWVLDDVFEVKRHPEEWVEGNHEPSGVGNWCRYGPQTEQTKQRISESLKEHYKTHPNGRSKKIVWKGVEYPTIKAASEATGYHRTHISAVINGRKPEPTRNSYVKRT